LARPEEFDAYKNLDEHYRLTRMAEACNIGSLGQLAWTSDWHIRDETYYVLALRCLVNQQQREPFAAHFGGGMASSSDGQFFQAAGHGRAAADLNAHYGHKRSFKAYTHLSDRYSPFYTKLIAATASIPMAAAILITSSPCACWSACSSRRVSRT
jgi:TnpA family transposase